MSFIAGAPTTKKLLAAVECQGRIYVIGTGGTVECYNPGTNSWCQQASTNYKYDDAEAQQQDFIRKLEKQYEKKQIPLEEFLEPKPTGGFTPRSYTKEELDNLPDPEGSPPRLRQIKAPKKDLIKTQQVDPVPEPVITDIKSLS